jgi:hypothetical protein
LKKPFSLVVALLVMLVLAGSALAQDRPRTSLVPALAPHPRAWFTLLTQYPSDPKPLHAQKVRHHTEKVPHHVQTAPRHIEAAHRPLHAKHGTTLSLYEQSVQPWILGEQGCEAAHRHESGVVILDFGKPAFEHHGYGTILFSGRFVPNHRITTGMVGWARGYVRCLPQGSSASVSLARGTSNYHPAVPSVYTAGLRWAGQTVKLQRKLQRESLDLYVTSAAADDAEPAWDRHFRKTREFVHGFRVAAQGHTLYDYGSLDGGVGSIWSAKQAFYVAGGTRHTAAIPEIYNTAQAQEWAQLAGIARSRYHSVVRFAGVMTQGSRHCHCSLRPHAAHRALARALATYGVQQTPLPSGGTNIRF